MRSSIKNVIMLGRPPNESIILEIPFVEARMTFEVALPTLSTPVANPLEIVLIKIDPASEAPSKVSDTIVTIP